MIIRSQDKRVIVNINNIDTILGIGNIIQSFNGGDDTGVQIGQYSTDEKTIKVLDMIQEEYQKPIYQNVIAENEVAIYKNKVFQMPQDSEV